VGTADQRSSKRGGWGGCKKTVSCILLDDGKACSKKDTNKARIRHVITKRRGVLTDINYIYYLAQTFNAAKLLK